MLAVLRCDIYSGSWRGAPPPRPMGSGLSGASQWQSRWLGSRVAGLSLLERHLLAFRSAGIDEVELWHFPEDPPAESILALARRVNAHLVVRPGPGSGDGPAKPFLEQRADTVVDPRLVSLAGDKMRAVERPVVFVDRFPENYAADEKSPYRVGAPSADDTREAGEAAGTGWPLGLEVKHPGSTRAPMQLDVGRHYWHRIAEDRDLAEAARKVFFGTFKPTDGIYARTNRRASVPISAFLADTTVTPNAVSLVTLGVSAMAGVLFAAGTYGSMLIASVFSWFASMLDGVDGELARAKFQATRVGAWLEMVCDYLYYVFVFAGMSLGVFRRTGDTFWLRLGAATLPAVVLAFVFVARLKKKHARRSLGGDFYLDLQRDLDARAGNPLYDFLRRNAFIATRAAAPYYIFLFALFDAVGLVLVIIFVGSQIAWPLAAYASHVQLADEPEREQTRLDGRVSSTTTS